MHDKTRTIKYLQVIKFDLAVAGRQCSHGKVLQFGWDLLTDVEHKNRRVGAHSFGDMSHVVGCRGGPAVQVNHHHVAPFFELGNCTDSDAVRVDQDGKLEARRDDCVIRTKLHGQATLVPPKDLAFGCQQRQDLAWKDSTRQGTHRRGCIVVDKQEVYAPVPSQTHHRYPTAEL